MKQTYYEKILEQLPFGLLFITGDVVSYINTSAENILGLSRKKIVHRSFDELSFSEKIKNIFKSVVAEKHVSKIYEETFINYFGKKFLLNLYFIPLTGKGEECIIVIEDCSFLKAIELTKQEHAQVEKLSTLFSSMAHEIKNPLGVVKGTLQLIRKEGLKNDENEAFDIVFSELVRIEKVIQSLIDYSSPKKVNANYISLLDIINEITISLKSNLDEKKIVILKEYDSTLPNFYGDKDSLYRAFFNIIKNAVEACYVGGKITIKVKTLLDMKYRENDKDYSYVVIEVADTGSGIKKEDMQKIFTPFFTTKPKGTGLGMVYAQKVAFDHGGFIKVESDKNRGTKIYIFLPMKGAK